MSDKCCARAEAQATHWEGCHTSHPECAAYRAGWEAGMRKAAEIVVSGKPPIEPWTHGPRIEIGPRARAAYSGAILKELGE